MAALTRQIRRWIAVFAALACMALTGFFMFAFYVRYWIWRDCFNSEGHCYDPVDGVMLEQSGLVWGGLAVIFLGLSLLFVVRAGGDSRGQGR
jgi:hypothetical protein